MSRSPNAQLAVTLYDQLPDELRASPGDAWKGIAALLLSCEVWKDGWKPFKDVVLYREVNDFKSGNKGPGAVLQRAEALSAYLAKELGVQRTTLCESIGSYWKHRDILMFQPNNLVGHAFKSLVVHVLRSFGDKDISYDEEVDPREEIPGHQFQTRSKNARIDIVARRGKQTVALMSARWRFRHDRVDVIDEALAYAPAARRQNPNCKFYAVIGEFAPNRLEKILSNCGPIHPNPIISAAVHFAPQLISQGLGENGRLKHLQSLSWLITQTHQWQ